MKSRILTMLFLVFAFQATAQKSMRDSSISFVMFGPSFQYQAPGGDLADRFGNNYNLGAFVNYKFSSNWMIGLEGQFLFADKVKEDGILDSISTADGNIIGESGEFATVYLYERGFHILAKVGKVIPLFGPNKNSGLLLTAGVGFLQHKIKIDVDKEDVPELSKEYKKGYDRLSNGPAITEGVSYLNCGSKRLINFSLGVECTQAFTQCRRDYNFDQMKKDTKQRLDLLFGIRLTWFFPVYKTAANSYFVN